MSRLTDLLEDSVGATTPTFDFDDVVARSDSLRRRRRASTAIGVAGVVCMLAIVGALSFGRRTTGPTVAVSPTTTEANSPHPVTSKNPCVNPGGRVTPAPGFDPNTATDAEIQAQDFPPRPQPNDTSASAVEYAKQWKQYVAWYLSGQVYQCLPSATIPTGGPVWGANFNWSGYDVNGQTWTDAEDAGNTAVSTTGSGAVSHWPGVNLGSNTANCDANPADVPSGHCNHPLIQGGIEQDASSCYVWWEAYPLNDSAAVDGCVVGDVVKSHVKMGTNGVMSWHLQNLGGAGMDPSNFSCASSSWNLGTGCNPYNDQGESPDGHVEWITEHNGPPVANFGSEYFTAPEAYSAATGWKYLNQVTNSTSWVVRYCGGVPCTPQVVLISPGGTDGFSGFTNTWYRAS